MKLDEKGIDAIGIDENGIGEIGTHHHIIYVPNMDNCILLHKPLCFLRLFLIS